MKRWTILFWVTETYTPNFFLVTSEEVWCLQWWPPHFVDQCRNLNQSSLPSTCVTMMRHREARSEVQTRWAVCLCLPDVAVWKTRGNTPNSSKSSIENGEFSAKPAFEDPFFPVFHVVALVAKGPRVPVSPIFPFDFTPDGRSFAPSCRKCGEKRAGNLRGMDLDTLPDRFSQG